MNTNYIKKQAIAGLLGELFEWTCHGSPEDKIKLGFTEPEDLHMFRLFLCMLAECHYRNKLRIKDVNSVIEYVMEIGEKHGHIDKRMSTGSWGVRWSQLRRIKDVLDIPDNQELLEYGSKYQLYNETDIIKGYRVYSTFLTLELKQPWNGNHEFEIPIEWSDLHKLYKEA